MSLLILSFFFNLFSGQAFHAPADHYLKPGPSADSIVEKTVIMRINGIDIEGTLLSSKTETSNQKLVIIIAGSGPTDRNGNSTTGDVTPDSYKLLAWGIANKNIAVFRYDKRGVSKSRPVDFDRKYVRFEDYINDAAKISDYMKDSLGFKDIWLLGHSEGSDIAFVAANQTAIKGVISLCGSGGGAGETVLRQIKEQMPSMLVPATAIIDSLKQGAFVYEVPQKLAQLFAIDAQPYWISWIRHIPSQEISIVNVPVLILSGACDEQVNVEEAMKLKAAKPESKLVIIERMTHMLKNAKANCKGDNTYTNPSLPLNLQLAKEIITFIGD